MRLNQIVVNRTSQFNVLMPLLVVLLVVVLTLLYALSQSKSGWAIAGVKLKERNREIGSREDLFVRGRWNGRRQLVGLPTSCTNWPAG